jgi:phosphoglycolate phosphatase
VKAVLWDLDGTLVDSAADIAAAVDRMLVRTGRPVLGEARVRGFIGEGARRLVDRCVAAAGGEAGDADVAVFLEEYRAGLVVRTRVFPPAIVGLLDAVRAPMAVVTNKPEAMSRDILARLDLARFFPVVIGGDTLPVRKPDPAPLFTALRLLGATAGVLVGDGPADVGAARAAPMWMIGVGWGIGAPVGADVLVGDVPALAVALREAGVAVDRERAPPRAG